MVYILLGCIAFLFLYIFDMNKIVKFHKSLNVFFLIGSLLLAFSSWNILFNYSSRFTLGLIPTILCYILAFISFCLMIYALFFALPFNKTYLDGMEHSGVVQTGMYALCRHPGVIWFFFLYLFLWLGSGVDLMFWAWIVWTIMDVIHVWVQDRFFFVKTLDGYPDYQQTTPFLIPSYRSIRQSLSTLKKEGTYDLR